MKKNSLNQTLQTFMQAFSNAPFSICWKNINRIFAGCNYKFTAENHNIKSASEIIGLSNAEFAKKLGWKDIMIAKMDATDDKVLTTGKTISYEYKFKRKNILKNLLIMKWPIKDHKGKIIGIACSPIDISKVEQDKLKLTTVKKQTVLNTNFLEIFSKTIIGKNITEKKSFDDTAKYLISFLENLIMNASDRVFWKDRNSVYLGGNKKVMEVTGFTSQSQLIGLTDFDLAKKFNWSKELAKKFRDEDQKVIKSGKPEVFEEKYKQADGKEVTVLTTKSPIKDEQGKVIGLIAVSTDISERKKQERELKQALKTAKQQTEFNTNFLEILNNTEIGKSITQKKSFEDSAKYLISFLENLIMNASDRVFWKDRNSVYLGCNKKVLEIAGLTSQSQIVGLTDFDFEKKCNWPKGSAKKFRKDDQEVIKSGKSKVFEEKYIEADGKETIALTTKSPIKDEKGAVIGLIAVSTDISDRKRQEQELKEAKEHAEKANRAKSEFLAIMSHELRTPLNGIMGTAQILRTRNLTPEQQEYVDDIYQSSNILLSLINDILDLTKLEEGRVAFASTPFDLKELIDEIGNSLKVLAKEKGLKFSIQYHKSIPTNIVSDPRRIRQIIFNLVGNAIKYTKKGSITLKVDCPKKTAKKAKFKISVKDTGAGIPKDKLQFVFDRFTRLESAYKAKTSGAGLGLAIVKQIVESMHGSIHVKSKSHQGSTFWCEFEFPLDLKKPKKKSKAPKKSTGKSTTTKETSAKPLNLKVLLVEDNIINQKVAKTMLQDLGCKVRLAGSGKAALKAINRKYDVIFMDIGLPDMDGYDVTAAILQGNSKNKNTPIIAMTAHAYKQDRQKCIDAGMKTVLTKPINYEQLKKTLRGVKS
ncbi:MAG: PAS domain-containing protein [Gammaproteobacteria bacterium]|jgi:PAS domain S-box-containing protein